jgi:hypothetical protein
MSLGEKFQTDNIKRENGKEKGITRKDTVS